MHLMFFDDISLSEYPEWPTQSGFPPHSRDIMHLCFENLCVHQIGAKTVMFLRWCKRLRKFPGVSAVNVDVRHVQNGRLTSISRYPCRPRVGSGKGSGKRNYFHSETPTSGSTIYLSVNIVFSVRLYAGLLLHLAMVQLNIAPKNVFHISRCNTLCSSELLKFDLSEWSIRQQGLPKFTISMELGDRLYIKDIQLDLIKRKVSCKITLDLILSFIIFTVGNVRDVITRTMYASVLENRRYWGYPRNMSCYPLFISARRHGPNFNSAMHL